jgi:alkanesulfonate monooxygenase SsuD/methylene tetrahydromethanopterin reductase-like flavin-dependent oxidoreductase (luciferase family)
MELGLHIADFTWTGGATALGLALARHARNAEAAGITRITAMDYFWQIRRVGPAENEMLEAYTALGFLAAHTQTVRLHTLVTGVINRQPALLAKAVTTLDVLSGGRAGLGVGAAWNDDESIGLGFGSRRSPSGSSGWKKPCRSACRCGPTPTPPTRASTTSWGAR